jgi:hypothetical protein
MTITILTQDAVKEMLPVLGKNLRDAEATIHQIAVSTLDHMRAHGDYRGALNLLNILPNGTRAEGLAAWFRNFSSGKFLLKRGEGRVWVGELRRDRKEDGSDFKVLAAMEVTFADFTNEIAPKPLTMVKFLASISKVANSTEKLPDGADKVPVEVKEAASAMLRQIRAA